METSHAVIADYKHLLRIFIGQDLLDRLKPGELEESGILLGRIKDDEGFIEYAYKLAEGVNSFRIDPVKWMKAVLKGEDRGLEYIGIYHTHPGGAAKPSPLDIRYMMECPGEVWLIVARKEAAAWTWGSAGLKRLELAVK